MDKIIEQFKRDGFTKVNTFGLTNNDALILSKLSNKLFDFYRSKKLIKSDFINYSPPSEGSEVISRFPEHDKKAFKIIEKILRNKNLKNILKRLLGTNYKLRDCSLRRSLPGDKGLYLHQDGIGETNLTIILSDNPNGNGSTCFLPGSHLIKTRMKEWDIETPPFLVRTINFVLKKTPGKIGDGYLFFNRTWHGRSINKSKEEYDAS